MTEMRNPFADHGYNPGLMDVAVQALKRGHNGEGEAMYIVVKGSDDIVELSPDERLVIATLVDKAVGIESARTVGLGILGMILPRVEQQLG